MRYLLLAFTPFLFSCHNKRTSNYFAFETLDKTLLESNQLTRNSSETIIKSLEDRLYYPETKIKAAIWYPKVLKVHGLVENVYKYIDGMKTEIRNAAGLRKETANEVFEKENKASVRDVIDKEGNLLYDKLVSLKDSLLSVNPLIQNEFKSSLFIIPQPYDRDREAFLKNFFDDLPAIGALPILSNFQQTLCLAENKIVSFCHSQMTYVGTHHWIQPIISQSSTILRPGEQLKIIAGIGEFMLNDKMEVTVKPGVFLPYRFDERFKGFGTHFLLIRHQPIFYERLSKALKQPDIKYCEGDVQYLDLKKYTGKKNCFQKDINYSWQEEYRILFQTKEIKPFEFEIGSLKDISEIYEIDKVSQLDIKKALEDI